MKFLNKFSLKVQLSFIIFILLLFVFVVSGIVVYNNQESLVIRQNDAYLKNQINAFSQQLDLANKELKRKVDQGMEVADWVFNHNYSGIIIPNPNKKIEYKAVNQVTHDIVRVFVDEWTMDGQLMQNNYTIVDKIKELGPSTVTIFQKIKEGYLRISTNVRREDGTRATGTFIPKNSPVIKEIENGKTYQGRAFVVDDWYTTKYKPIYVNGKIQGILYVGEKQREINALNDESGRKRFLEKGYPFIMSDNEGFKGLMIMHPLLKGVNIRKSGNAEQKSIYLTFINNYDAKIRETGNPETTLVLQLKNTILGENVMIYYQYNQSLKYYLGIVVPYANFVQDEMNKLIRIIIIRFIIGIFVSLLLIHFFVNIYTKQIAENISSLRQLANGSIPDKISISGKDEIAQTTEAINKLVDNTNELTNRVKQIEQGNYHARVRVKSDDDQLAISFNNMAEKLIDIEQRHHEQLRMREAESDLFEKTRIAKDIHEFGVNALASIGHFLHAQIGVFYVYEQHSKSLKFQSSIGIVEPKNKVGFAPGQGIVGQVAQQDETLRILNDIPQDFYQISTGAGSGTVKQIALFPLMHNNQLLGVVELASFSIFNEKDQELMILLKEAFSISLNITLANLETQALLEQIQVQTEELRVTNETLENQAHSLQVSEENLQVQQEELRVTNEELELQAQSLMKSEQEITKQKEVLEQEMEKRAEAQKQLELAVEKANAATKAKSMFLANMSHEIRTPMNGVIGISDILAQTSLNEEQHGYVKLITTSANNLLTIINDILDFSKIEAGKIDMETIPFSIKNIIEDTAEVLHFKAVEKNNQLFTFVENDVPLSVMGDPVRLQQVMMNLANNAVKFTDNGEVTLSCEVNKIEDGKAYLRFKVKDTGIGISEEGKKKLFQSFSQVDASTTRKFGGTGLGLIISKKLVEKMHGELDVESKANEGSTFFFDAIFDIDEDGEKQKSLDQRNYHDLNVLVVDSHESSQLIFTKYLEAKNAQVTCVASPSKGIELIQAQQEKGNPFQLVFVDYQMPEISGIQFVQKFRDQKQENAIRFVLLGTHMDVIDENEIKNCQIVSLLHKPIKRASLYSTIEDVVYGEVKKQKTSAKENKTVKKLHKKLKVLLAEDNVINQKVAVYNLEDWGHEVEVAENGEIAFQKYKNEAYDLILMDIQMPILDGLKATKKIREYEKERGKTAVKIVAMTANALKGDDQICYDAGMDAYISKPFKREDFENLINS